MNLTGIFQEGVWGDAVVFFFRNIVGLPDQALKDQALLFLFFRRTNQDFSRLRFGICLGMCLGIGTTLFGCVGKKPEILLYSDVDRSIVEPIVQAFEQEKKIPVTVTYASPEEVQGGIGLAKRVREEASDQKVDLYLAQNPLAMEKFTGEDETMEVSKNGTTAQIAEPFRDPDFRWIGLRNRVRVLLYSSQKIDTKRVPHSFAALVRPEWKGRAAMSDPRKNGSSRYHLLVYFAAYGEREGKELLAKMLDNRVQLVENEKAVASAVLGGKADWGVLDSDAAAEALVQNPRLRFVVADQDDFSTSDALDRVRGGTSLATLGTPALCWPLAAIKNRPHKTDALELMGYFAAPKTAFQLEQATPNLLPTRADAAADPPRIEKGHILHAAHLKYAAPSPSEISKVSAAFIVALDALGGLDKK